MKAQLASTVTPDRLLHMTTGIVTQQALYAAASLGVADLIGRTSRPVSDIAAELQVNEPMLLRVMRLLASQGVFEEVAPQVFANSPLSSFLRTGVPGSVRSILIFRGSDFCLPPFAEILHSVQTGEPAREKLYGKNGFDYMKEDPAMARVFDDAITNMSQLIGPAVADVYDFGAWRSVMDVGGGNGALLAAILKAHPKVHGVLADMPHVLDRARERGFLGGELELRSELQPCDFFREVPSGSRAYVMKSVIHDWDDERARQILVNCRRASHASRHTPASHSSAWRASAGQKLDTRAYRPARTTFGCFCRWPKTLADFAFRDARLAAISRYLSYQFYDRLKGFLL
jgi:hypothetical protein